MAISAKTVKELRDKTNAGMMDCKKALEEAEGDLEKAVEVLRERGIAKAAKKSGRTTNEGLIAAYIHPGDKLGGFWSRSTVRLILWPRPMISRIWFMISPCRSPPPIRWWSAVRSFPRKFWKKKNRYTRPRR